MHTCGPFGHLTHFAGAGARACLLAIVHNAAYGALNAGKRSGK